MWQPLCSLAKALAGPQNLIKKRLDKLLDFERVEEKLLEAGSVTYEEQEARHTYQALNSLLVAELPQLNQLAMHWLGQILCTFVGLQRDLAKHVLQRAEGSLAQVRPLGLGLLCRIARQGLIAPSASCWHGLGWSEIRPSGAQEVALDTFWISLVPVLPALVESDHESKDRTGTPGHSWALGFRSKRLCWENSRPWGQSLECIRRSW